MVDITRPIIISTSPSSGFNGLPEIPRITYSLVDPGNPPVGLDQSTLNVYVKEHPEGGQESAPIHVIQDGVVREDTPWDCSYFYTGNISSQELSAASSSIESAEAATLVLKRISSLSSSCKLLVSIVTSDLNGNVSGDENQYPFTYRVRESVEYGASLLRDNKFTLLHDQMLTEIKSSRGLSLANLDRVKLALVRLSVVPDLIDGTRTLSANFGERSVQRLAQILVRLGREHFLTRWWELGPEFYADRKILGAVPLERFFRNLFLGRFPTTLEKAKQEFKTLINSEPSFDVYALDEIETACRYGAHRYSNLVLAILMSFYVARLRVERPEHFL